MHHVVNRDGVIATRLASRSHFARHTHDAFGIGVIERGAQKSWSGRGPVEAGPGDVITVNPGEVHDGAPIGSDGRSWKMLYIEPEIIRTLAFDLSEACDAALEFRAPVFADHTAVRKMFLSLFRHITEGSDIRDIRCETALLRLLALVGTQVPRPNGSSAPIRRAKDFIDDQPERQMKLDELARLCGLTKFQFLRSFSRATGLTPHAYIVQARLQRAKRLITAGEAIATTAAACGFSDQSHLTRVFVSSYGFTPGQL